MILRKITRIGKRDTYRLAKLEHRVKGAIGTFVTDRIGVPPVIDDEDGHATGAFIVSVPAPGDDALRRGEETYFADVFTEVVS